MRSNYSQSNPEHRRYSRVTVLLLGAGVSFAQSVNLTAAPANASPARRHHRADVGLHLRRGSGRLARRTCAAVAIRNAGANWSPVVITVPTGHSLTINLTNSLPRDQRRPLRW